MNFCAPSFFTSTASLVLLVLTARESLAEDLSPIVPDGFAVDVIATEPFVRNPCALAFDRFGRICIGQGPQYRNPTPETPGDRVDILIDRDGDGRIDDRKTFAKGFNCIQGLAWRGNDLYVANAPDLTIVRDLDGDDVADEYVRVFTDLGNLEHGLHGLNFCPDGRLYMSKGNSRGHNRPDHYAPAAFRELWGMLTPENAAALETKTYSAEEYQHAYHDPSDDWGQQGGILRCDPDGSHLEIVSRGCRNPWDIAFDDGFDWLGTDNDQTQGDKIVAPFHGAHFGWGHTWSYDWTGEGHLPTVPASTQLFEGSGTGVTFYRAPQFPDKYRNVFFINDWLRREIYLFRPAWRGALRTCADDFPPVFAHAGGGRSMPASSGRLFSPTDIETGPDGGLYVLSWGRGYGASVKDGQQQDVGRIYRIRSTENDLLDWELEHRRRPHSQWSFEQLSADLLSIIPAWRTNAQTELVRRCNTELAAADKHRAPKTIRPFEGSRTASRLALRIASQGWVADSDAEATWILWTLGQVRPGSSVIDSFFKKIAADESADDNSRIQALRVMVDRGRGFDSGTPPNPGTRESSVDLRPVVRLFLESPNERLRHEMVQAIWQLQQKQWVPELLRLAATETDRVTFYSTWNALKDLSSKQQLQKWLARKEPGIRLAALLAMFEKQVADTDDVLPLRSDADPRVAGLVEHWLQQTGGAEPIVTLQPSPGEYSELISVTMATSVEGGEILYTLDGSTPEKTSPRYRGPVPIKRNSILKVAVHKDGIRNGPVVSGDYQIQRSQTYVQRPFVSDINVASGNSYEIDWTGLRVGVRHYTDRGYKVTHVPPELLGLPFLRTANNDDRSSGDSWLRLESETDLTVYLGLDVRISRPLKWMQVGVPGGFSDTGLILKTSDPDFRIYRKDFTAGEIVLGGNTNSSQQATPRGNYIAMFDQRLLTEGNPTATASEVLAAMSTADPSRGRDLFLHPRGAGCAKCHRMEGIGRKYAPDLSDAGSRMKKAEILVQSILKPSAVITEGFAQQQIVTTAGKVFTGAIIEETGLAIKIVDQNGQATTIRKSAIEERQATKISPMPAGFEKLLTAQQTADIVSWLMTKTQIGDRSGFTLRDAADQVDVFFQEQRIATYLKRHPKLTRRALVNMMTHTGIPVTRNFPARAPEDIDPGVKHDGGIIHPIMHPGLWIGYGNLDGQDNWRLKAPVRFIGYEGRSTATKEDARFSVRNRYLKEDGESVICDEITHYWFRRVDDGIQLRLDAEYQSDRDFFFGDQEESGLAIRVASPIRVRGGNGTIVNSRGDVNEAGVRGSHAPWFDYSGEIDNRKVGLMVVQSPGNPETGWLHARDYGVVAASPFPRQPREQRKAFVRTPVRNGEQFRLSWVVLIHDHAENETFDRRAAFQSALRFMEN